MRACVSRANLLRIHLLYYFLFHKTRAQRSSGEDDEKDRFFLFAVHRVSCLPFIQYNFSSLIKFGVLHEMQEELIQLSEIA